MNNIATKMTSIDARATDQETGQVEGESNHRDECIHMCHDAQLDRNIPHRGGNQYDRGYDDKESSDKNITKRLG